MISKAQRRQSRGLSSSSSAPYCGKARMIMYGIVSLIFVCFSILSNVWMSTIDPRTDMTTLRKKNEEDYHDNEDDGVRNVVRPNELETEHHDKLDMLGKMDQHKEFDILTREFLSEYDADTVLYKHERTGMEVLSILWKNNTEERTYSKKHKDTKEDHEATYISEERVFGISFRTPPSSQNGLPHILEHSVLCGSQKFPVKDPFLHLKKSSLHTYLNAMTFPDRTVYAVASRNQQDFYNLVNVYLDAVFFPLCVMDNGTILQQEGWHYDLTNTEEEEQRTVLEYSGIVLNEMKGAFYSPDHILQQHTNEAIFPDTVYRFTAGGDPAHIPDLNYEEMVNYHNTFYHPSNAKVYVSGLQSEEEEEFWQLLNDYLKGFDKKQDLPTLSQISFQPKSITTAKTERYPYPSDSESPSHMMLTTWLLNDKELLSPFEELTWTVLEHLLIGTPTAILRKTLMESGLGNDLADGTGFQVGLLQNTFSIGLQQVATTQDIPVIEMLILEILQEVVEQGFSAEDIAAAINTIEFQLREQDASSRGVSFLIASTYKWNYDANPLDSFRFEDDLSKLKILIQEKESEVFLLPIQSCLLQNNHRVTIELFPSNSMEENIQKEEQLRLHTIQMGLDENDVSDIKHSMNALTTWQNTDDPPEIIKTIPTLSMKDIQGTTSIEYPIAVTTGSNGIQFVKHELATSTSQILYVDIGIDISSVPYEDIVLLRLFEDMLFELDTISMSNRELSQLIGKDTGGLDSMIYVMSVNSDEQQDEITVQSEDNIVTYFFLRGKTTISKIDQLFTIFRTIISDTQFDDNPKALQILKRSIAQSATSIQSSGHVYSNTRIQSHFTVTGYLNEKLKGATFLESSRKLLVDMESDWPSILVRLENIQKIMKDTMFLGGSGLLINYTGDRKVMKIADPYIKNIESKGFGKSSSRVEVDLKNDVHPWISKAKSDLYASNMKDVGFVIPTQVSYVGKGARIFEAGEIAHGSISTILHYLENGYLWENVRMKGGAYGAFSSFAMRDGVLSFISYRDPNLKETLELYDEISSFLERRASIELQDSKSNILELQIIGTIGNLDGAILSARAQGLLSLSRWLKRESAKARQKWREDIINTTIDDFDELQKRIQKFWWERASSVIISSETKLENFQENHNISILYPV